MKKTYINPNIEVITIASQQQMLAGSPTEQPQNGDAITSAMGREFDFDEDEY